MSIKNGRHFKIGSAGKNKEMEKLDKDRIRVEGIFYCFVDGKLYNKFFYKVKHSYQYLALCRNENAFQASALLILESQINECAQKLCEKHDIKDAEIEVMPAALKIYDKKFPDYSTLWVMI